MVGNYEIYVILGLKIADACCLGAPFSLLNLKGHTVTLGEGFETLFLNFGEVYKHIATVIVFNEPEAFFVTKPFYDACCHSTYLLFSNILKYNEYLIISNNREDYNTISLCIKYVLKIDINLIGCKQLIVGNT